MVFKQTSTLFFSYFIWFSLNFKNDATKKLNIREIEIQVCSKDVVAQRKKNNNTTVVENKMGRNK